MPKYLTKQRRLIIDYLSKHPDESLTAGQLAEALADSVSKSAVYRNLADMEAEGTVRRVASPGGHEAIYQYVNGQGCEGCLHLSCKKCGKTVHMQKQIADALVSKVEENDRFSIDKGETIIYGVCAECQE